MSLELISIEVTNRCAKACWFCYNHSQPEGSTVWTVAELVAFIRDCADNGIKAVSFGGGEPLQFGGIFDVLEQLRGVVFRSLTSNGLLLHGAMLDRLIAARPDKIHLSVHFPDRHSEVRRVIRQACELQELGIQSGVNFLVARSQLVEAERAAAMVRAAGIDNHRIVYLPMRGRDTPAPRELADVAGNTPFQSMTCLTLCAKSPRFVSIGWDRTVAWCSYTCTRRKLRDLTYRALGEALDGLGLEYCADENEQPRRNQRLVLPVLLDASR